MQALLRRHWHSCETTPRHQLGDVDLSRCAVSKDCVEIHLTQIEYRLLAVMLANNGKVLTHRHLIHEEWEPGHTDQGHYLRIYVGRLRQKLESDPAQPRHILTETGVGYRLQQS